jgi:hypothetical protein
MVQMDTIFFIAMNTIQINLIDPMDNTLFQPKTIGRMVNWFLAVHDGSCASWHSIAVQMDQIHNILFSVTN